MSRKHTEDKTKKDMAELIRKKDEQISALKKEKEEYTDKWMRALAEMENYRKRAEKQREEAKKFALEEILYQLLTVADNFDRALAHIGDAKSNDNIKEGIEMIYKELNNLFIRHGVKKLQALGKDYDPNFHEALEVVEEKHNKEGRSIADKHVVIEEILPGYTLYDRLLRPAKVKVSGSEKTEKPKVSKGE